MERKMINEQELDQVVGGTILFSPDKTTCGRNADNQYKVLNYDAVISYIAENRMDMTESRMIKNMVAAGLLANL